MTRKDVPAYFQWRGGRPRWEPGPSLRLKGFKGQDLKDAKGDWLHRDAAIAAAMLLIEKTYQSIGDPRAPSQRLPQNGTILRYGLALLWDLIDHNVAPRNYRELPEHGAYVYIYTMEGRHAKIGFTTNPRKRYFDLRQGVPELIRLVLLSPGSRQDEKTLKRHFKRYRSRGEWFVIEDDLAIWIDRCLASFRQNPP